MYGISNDAVRFMYILTYLLNILEIKWDLGDVKVFLGIKLSVEHLNHWGNDESCVSKRQCLLHAH